MSLSTEVQARYSVQKLANLTNPDSPETATLTAAKLDAAATDVEADFVTELGRAFDLASPQDVSVAVEGVIAKLEDRTGNGGAIAGEMVSNYFKRLRSLRPFGAPVTTSKLTPSDEVVGSETVRPEFDAEKFRDFIPDDRSAAAQVERWGQ